MIDRTTNRAKYSLDDFNSKHLLFSYVGFLNWTNTFSFFFLFLKYVYFVRKLITIFTKSKIYRTILFCELFLLEWKNEFLYLQTFAYLCKTLSNTVPKMHLALICPLHEAFSLFSISFVVWHNKIVRNQNCRAGKFIKNGNSYISHCKINKHDVSKSSHIFIIYCHFVLGK